ncbi:hypothetical protein, partial [Streptomyces vinaceusdrappus]|uniref:hypothetical protein n=1 Tax=Streptomyces vinaceusdrappus TaxID=67376 RepID=UPI001873618C
TVSTPSLNGVHRTPPPPRSARRTGRAVDSRSARRTGRAECPGGTGHPRRTGRAALDSARADRPARGPGRARAG